MANLNRRHDRRRVPYSSRFHTLGKVQHNFPSTMVLRVAIVRARLELVHRCRQPHRLCRIHPHLARSGSIDCRRPQCPPTIRSDTEYKRNLLSPILETMRWHHRLCRQLSPIPTSGHRLSSLLIGAILTDLPEIFFLALPNPQVCRPGPPGRRP
jgi:hypothetical protein